MPDMQKSIYASQLYPETRADWRSFPTLTWVTDSLIPYCQKEFKLLLPKQNNYLFGISTGGRGVALLSLYTDSIFIAGAALSGDYDQVADTSDNLVRGYYGAFNKFPERWKGKDNPLMNANKLKIPLFIAHGKSDNIVPYQQSVNFFDAITKIKPGLGHKINLQNEAGHNYKFWNTEYTEVFVFFQNHSEK
jgi:dipeptidyl aminopeptidase/acylaminoacyl peptidase